jgi:hypothetical protein
MNRVARAAQFAPFAALSGFEELVIEEARVTDERRALSEEEKIRISDILSNALENGKSAEISITYFVSDKYKKGGSYVTRVGTLASLDAYRRVIIMTDGGEIPIDDITEVSEPF